MKYLVTLLIATNVYALEVGNIDFAAGLDQLKNGPTASCSKTNNKTGFAFTSKYRENGANCSKFINSEGVLGSHGKEIFNHIDKVSNSKYMNSNFPQMSTICPNWTHFKPERKKYFWVWFFAALAWKESTCNENAVNKNATSGVAVGYLQLNEKKTARHWRGDDSGDSCAATEVKSAANNIRCSLEIFNEQLQGKKGIYEGNGQLAGKGSNSYWQDLRGDKSRVVTMVKEFPGCK